MKRCAIPFLMAAFAMCGAGLARCDEILYQSPKLLGGAQPVFADIALKEGRYLHLIVEDGGDSNANDHADWAEAELVTSDGRHEALGNLNPILKEQGWGLLQKDRSCDGFPLTIGRREFATGLGTHAYSHLVYRWDGAGSRFSSYMGIDSSQNDKGSVVFKVAVSQDFINPATTAAPRGEPWWIEQSRSYDRIARETKRIDLVFLGDSITEFWNRDGRNIWSRFYGNRYAVNFGIAGDRAENVLWRIENGNFEGTIAAANPKVIVLMLGTNNSAALAPEYIAQGVAANVAALRAKAPQSRILLLAIFPRGASPEDPLRQAVGKVNPIIAGLADNQHVFYQDLAADLLEKDGALSPQVMPDYLHPSEEGYLRWAQAMEGTLVKMLAL